MGIPAWAIKGAKVVCVDAVWSSIPPANPLRDRAVYTLEQAFISDRGIGSELWCYLREVINPIAPDWGFNLDRFAPAVTRSQEQDIAEHFRPLLNIDHREDA
jgi:hypothetical protein